MLKQRILTALVLLPIILVAVFATASWPFWSVTTGIVLVASWEWSALIGWTRTPARIVYSLLTALGMLSIAIYGRPSLFHFVYALALPGWLWALVRVWRYRGEEGVFLSLSAPFLGWAVLLPAWLALNELKSLATAWLLYLFILVWGADTGAYFAGRRFGRTKLAPMVSPGKSVEGVIGGVALTAAVAVVVAWRHAWTFAHSLEFLLLSLCTVAASVLGDLFESMLKRQRGVKDSGTIFPGHGGALDRIDSLTAAAPIFLLGWVLLGGF